MFLALFYMLRTNGIKVSLGEWLSVMEGLQLGLHGSTLSGFYTLCRAVVVTSEADFDRFDQVFFQFFHDIGAQEQIPEEILRWVQNPELSRESMDRLATFTDMTEEEIERLFAQRLQDQKAEHNGGRKWIGTGGYTAYGNRGKVMGGIRVGGKSHFYSAFRTAGARSYRDWRSDCTIDSRQFQMAFHSLRQLCRGTDQLKTELDIDATIHKTCKNGGRLQVEYTYPRKNSLKLLLLIDSGGSMEPYQQLCSLLFQSVSKDGHFQDLKIYYFHNCIGKTLYLSPTLKTDRSVSTQWVLNNTAPDYRVIFVGDGEMSLDELVSGRNWYSASASIDSGLDWLLKFRRRYAHTIWLHPQPRPQGSGYWTRSFEILEQQFDLYRLSLDGLTQGIKKLMVNR